MRERWEPATGVSITPPASGSMIVSTCDEHRRRAFLGMTSAQLPVKMDGRTHVIMLLDSHILPQGGRPVCTAIGQAGRHCLGHFGGVLANACVSPLDLWTEICTRKGWCEQHYAMIFVWSSLMERRWIIQRNEQDTSGREDLPHRCDQCVAPVQSVCARSRPVVRHSISSRKQPGSLCHRQ